MLTSGQRYDLWYYVAPSVNRICLVRVWQHSKHNIHMKVHVELITVQFMQKGIALFYNTILKRQHAPVSLTPIFRTQQKDKHKMTYTRVNMGSGNGWRNWYRVWGHGCDTTDSQMSPQPRRSRDCGDIWESVVSQPWPQTRYQFLFYHGTTQLTLKYESLPSQTASQLSKFKEQSHCKHWVIWPDCFATPSNHCDLTTGPVSLICIDTLDKNMS